MLSALPVLLLPLACALSPPASLQHPFSLPTNNSLITPRVDAYIRAQQAYWNSSGLAVAVVRRREPSEWDIEFGSYGTARADGTLVSPDTLFAIASDSKLFTAVAVGLLVNNQSLAEARGGKWLRWDTRIADVLGDEWGLMDEEMQRGVTLQDMLSHRTGMPRHDLSGFAREGGVPEMISTLRYLRPSASLREQYQYNNLMYEVLSHLPPTLLNQSFESYITQHILTPLGMNSSTYSVAEAEARLLPDGTPQLAHGFHWSMKDSLVNRTGVLTPSEYFQRPGEEKVWAGAAGILASARDLSTWVAMLLNEGRHPFTNTTVIPADIIEHVALGASVSLQKAEYPETSPKVYGCGQNRFSYRGHEIIEHGGSNPGFKSIVTRLPHAQIGIVVLTNDDDGVRVMEPVKFHILDELLGFSEDPTDWAMRYVASTAKSIQQNQAVTPRPKADRVRLPSTEFARMQGRFGNGAYGEMEPCFVGVEVDSARNEMCEEVLNSPVVRRILAASESDSDSEQVTVPTLIVPFKRTFSSYIRLAHFDGNLFNASVIWTIPSAAAHDQDDKEEGEGEEEVIVGLDRRYLAEWVPGVGRVLVGDDAREMEMEKEKEKEKDGWAFRGDFWGKEGEVLQYVYRISNRRHAWESLAIISFESYNLKRLAHLTLRNSSIVNKDMAVRKAYTHHDQDAPAALTFGSFGDILEAAKIAKRVIDVLRTGGGSHERQKLISTLKTICDDMAGLTVLPEGYFTTRLWEEVALCRSLLDQFYARIQSYASLLGRIRMVALEEKELAFWRAQILERRAALLHLLGPIISVQVHDVGERVGQVGSQVQYLGHKVENVGNEVGALSILITNFLSAEVSRMGSEIRQVGADVQRVQQATLKMSPYDISDPVFFVRDPLGRPITIQLSLCDTFDHCVHRRYHHPAFEVSRSIESRDGV
ncbi:beta-lactamase/transpeptidase-like protein [Mycena amicta]|nr:beta-lactamase/transpeptidase-like protein [Mycena amicta]